MIETEWGDGIGSGVWAVVCFRLVREGDGIGGMQGLDLVGEGEGVGGM